MEVILLERIEKLGQMGDVVKVKDGFARNFLLPQKKALRASENNLAYFEKERVTLEANNLKQKQEAEVVLEKLDNFNLIIKRKRESILADRRYLNLIKAYSSDNSLIEADTIHAPEDLILYSDIVISMPYTSTALIAQSQKKPSVFYDSTGMLFDSPYNDLPIISSIKSLEDWVNKVIDSK